MDTALILTVIMVGLFAAYNLFHCMLFFLVTHPRDAGDIGHALNEFEQRQLVEWAPKAEDFLKHDDENRTYDDVFGQYRGENDNYSTCFFPAQPLRALTMLNASYSSLRMECVCLTSDADQAPRAIILPTGAASIAGNHSSRADIC